MHHNDLINYKASQSVKLLQVCRNPDYLYQIVVKKELKLIKTNQNKNKTQFESLKKLALPHLSIIERTCRKNSFFMPLQNEHSVRIIT